MSFSRLLLLSTDNLCAACSIWRDAQVQQEQYRYYKQETRGLDQEGLLEDLSKGKAGDVVLLHACAHNPTGWAPSHCRICLHWPELFCWCVHRPYENQPRRLIHPAGFEIRVT